MLWPASSRGRFRSIILGALVAATSWALFASCQSRETVPDAASKALPGKAYGDQAALKAASAPSERQPVVYRVSYGNALSATIRYFKVYEKWPTSWSDVRSAGLCPAALRTPDGKAVDPDDGTLDFDDDFTFEPPVSGQPPRLVLRMDALEAGLLDQEVPTPSSYSDILGRLEEGNPGYELVDAYLNDPARLTQWAIAGQLIHRIETYRYLKGHFPKTLDEYLASGMAVIGVDSVNPLTGRTYAGDGSANDFYYEYIDEEVTPTIHPMDADGKPCRILVNY